MSETGVIVHWGQWVKSRIFYLGFRSQRSFAKAVGCGQDCLWRWMDHEVPPVSMRRGLDVALCRELRTDQFTLFTNYQKVRPDAAPLEPEPRKPDVSHAA